MKDQDTIFKELRPDVIEEDQDQPRKSHGKENKKDRLYHSIKKRGMQQAIVVNEVEDGRYIIIDGHRRYRFAQEMGLEKIPCRIHRNLGEGDFASLQFEIQNVRKEWKPYERADALARIKKGMGFKTNKELADHIGLSQAVISSSLHMIEQSTKYTEMMAEYELPLSYRVEFLRLKPKLRKVKDIETNKIIEILFQKVKDKAIGNAKDFRRLRKIFLRCSINQEQIYEFLTDKDMTAKELETLTSKSRIALLADHLLEELGNKMKNGKKDFKDKEISPCLQIRDFLLKAFPLKKYSA